ncbi:ABC transporter permease [Ligilactobacillus salivarius]
MRIFRNKLLIILYVCLLAFCSVWVFFKIQERDIVNQLNNHNLSQNAYEVVMKGTTSLEDINNKISNSSKIDDVQVHYQDKKNSNLTYFFGKGDYSTTPMVSGSFFADNDFNSEVTVALVGKNIAKKLYKPKDQDYLKINSGYLPVLGVMGEKRSSSSLDDQIFISGAISTLKTLTSNDYRIVIDSEKPLDAKVIKHILGAKEVKTMFTNSLGIPKGVWLTSLVRKLVALLFIFVAFLAEAILWGVSYKRRYVIKRATVNRATFQEWQVFTILAFVGMSAGTILGLIYFTLYSYTGTIIFNSLMLITGSIVCYLTIYDRIKKQVKE